MPTEKPRYCITVDDETLKEIDDFRFEKSLQQPFQSNIGVDSNGIGIFKNKRKR